MQVHYDADGVEEWLDMNGEEWHPCVDCPLQSMESKLSAIRTARARVMLGEALASLNAPPVVYLREYSLATRISARDACSRDFARCLYALVAAQAGILSANYGSSLLCGDLSKLLADTGVAATMAMVAQAGHAPVKQDGPRVALQVEDAQIGKGLSLATDLEPPAMSDETQAHEPPASRHLVELNSEAGLPGVTFEQLINDCEVALAECLRQDAFDHRSRLLLATLCWKFGRRTADARRHCECLVKPRGAGGKRATLVWNMWQYPSIDAVSDRLEGLLLRSYELHEDCMALARLYADVLQAEALPRPTSHLPPSDAPAKGPEKPLTLLRALADLLYSESPQLRRHAMLCHVKCLAEHVDAVTGLGTGLNFDEGALPPEAATADDNLAADLQTTSNQREKPSNHRAIANSDLTRHKELLRRTFETHQDIEYSALLSELDPVREPNTLLLDAFFAFRSVHAKQSDARSYQTQDNRVQQQDARTTSQPRIEEQPPSSAPRGMASACEIAAMPSKESQLTDAAVGVSTIGELLLSDMSTYTAPQDRDHPDQSLPGPNAGVDEVVAFCAMQFPHESGKLLKKQSRLKLKKLPAPCLSGVVASASALQSCAGEWLPSVTTAATERVYLQASINLDTASTPHCAAANAPDPEAFAIEEVD